ncbi:hypothetical protein SK803_02165 [Lentzea sp. BCCO 10_0856]|uniref:PPE family protein n=1 Tax=Lentzea miocenica TaxID=3095431 RepID=A0ABU4ST56_9PSEU|nr:hypothetical protein [Lentzea sp. BCCO 10_0856]MDX8028992.1 hypothetical protein [Lentzea sp. BCCO 10_0856]
MSGNESPPTEINWEAYSHEELHRMLWQDADVADVSTVADEWTRHRAALDTHAEVLREQRTALLHGWHGAAAEEAAARLATLAERIEKISELAAAGQQAAQDSADALAAARAAMPPPPPAGTTMPAFAGPPAGPAASAGPAGVGAQEAPMPVAPGPFGSPSVPTPVGSPLAPGPFELLSAPGEFGSPSVPASFGAPLAPGPFEPLSAPGQVGSPSVPASFGAPFVLPNAPAPLTTPAAFDLPTAPAAFSLPSAPSPFSLPSAPAPFALPSAPAMPAGSPGFSFYFGVATADQQKAQAVRAMQTYESSLNGSGRLIDDARGNVPQAASTAQAAAATPVRTPSSGGVPWQRLVGGGSGGSVATTRGSVIGAGSPMSPVSQQTQLSPGMRTGVMFGQAVGPTITGSPIADARSAAQNGAMGQPLGGARKDDDQEHENQMPTLDHGLFAVNERVSPAVIGEEQ